MQSAFSCQAFDEDGIKCALSTLAARHTTAQKNKLNINNNLQV